MSNGLITCALVAKESLAILENMLSFSAGVNRNWQDEFGTNQARGYSPGATINIKKPPRYTYRAGRVATPQPTVESTIPLTLSQGGCDLFFTSFEKTLQIQQWEQKIRAGVAAIANQIDLQGLDLARTATFNAIGTPGVAPNTQLLAIQAMAGINQRLDEMGAMAKDRTRRSLIGNPAFQANLLPGFAGLFNDNGQVSKQYTSGMIQTPFGLNFGMDQNVAVQTNGTANVTTNTVNGAGQQGSTITVNALNGTVTKGTKITFAGVFAVNPQNRISTATLAQFVVTADAANAATSLSISPAIVNSGAFQNVTASPANAAGITILGTASGSYAANVGYDRDAFTLAMVPLDLPSGGGVMSAHQETDNGFTIRVVEYYDGTNDIQNMRLDVLFGWAAPYPELACVYAQ
jgi:hypothetical protein